MVERIIELSVRHKWLVFGAVVALLGYYYATGRKRV